MAVILQDELSGLQAHAGTKCKDTGRIPKLISLLKHKSHLLSILSARVCLSLSTF
jgi:hypothetical protein